MTENPVTPAALESARINDTGERMAAKMPPDMVDRVNRGQFAEWQWPPEEPEPAIHAVQRIRKCTLGGGCEGYCTCRATVEEVLRSHIPGSPEAALAMMRRIAAMTDDEADFLDPTWWRNAARLALGGELLTVPAVYTDTERDRAAYVLARRFMVANINIALSAPTIFEMVDDVAKALGMERKG